MYILWNLFIKIMTLTLEKNEAQRQGQPYINMWRGYEKDKVDKKGRGN